MTLFAPIVIREFGTKTQITWLSALVDYLISLDQRGHYFWCLNPNSGDTGGLLKDDWTSPETAKLEQLDRLQPNPTTITVNGNQVCFEGLGDISSSYTENDDSNKNNGAVIAIVVILVVLLVIAGIVGLVYYLKKRNTNKGDVTFDHKDGTVGNDTPIEDVQDDVAEIEVEATVETTA